MPRRPAAHPEVPVGIFWDLDNVHPDVLSRAEVGAYTEPLSAMASAFGRLSRFAAFANVDTFAYVSPIERSRQKEMEDMDMDEWDMDRNFSGWDDEAQTLRCGVCGSKHSSHAKLQKHYKNLHAREAKKAQMRLSQTKKKGGAAKEKLKGCLAKYRAAAVDVMFTSDVAKASGSTSKSNLKQILKEAGVKCYSVPKKKNAADAKLMSDAGTFLARLDKPGSDIDDVADGVADGDGDSDDGAMRPFRAVLVLASGDSDYVPLLQRCRKLKVAAVLAHSAELDDVLNDLDYQDFLHEPGVTGVSRSLMEISDGYLCIETLEFSPLSGAVYGDVLASSLKGSMIRAAPRYFDDE